MRVPEQVLGGRWLTALVVGYGVVWMALEGDLRRVVILGVGATAVALGHIIQRYLTDRAFRSWTWLLTTAGLGLLFGLSSGILTILFMGLKTGLHAHGPEFTPSELQWVIQQLPLWILVGLLGGLGLGLIILARQPSSQAN